MTSLSTRTVDLERSNRENEAKVVSPWRNPVPLKEFGRHPVVVYYRSDRWIPIAGFSLAEAIGLYRKARFLGKEILVYPPNLDLCTQVAAGIPKI
ncbi:MAG TPA: hypothetical protein DCE56_28495 [Cyanobacteria bacterium UBA8553]|nr:hypothetical protein [Cyanobacteria bacterium UBA8553]HAJ59934.1 hypothetical protein [Cyanobacteria bacterium UBA8543]